MATRMQQRRGTAAQWTSADPILASGEIGFESDTNQFKIGDGINHWSDLSYFKNLEDLGGSLDDYVPISLIGEPSGVASLDVNGGVPISQLGNIIDAAPGALDTLAELANAIEAADGIVSTKIDVALGDAAADAEAKANAAQAAAEQTAAGYVSTHNSSTTNVHGISDTAEIATKSGTETLTNKTIDTANNTITVVVADVSDITATAAELNILDGVTATTAEINHLDGVTSGIQNQLDSKAPLANPTFTGTVTAGDLSVTGDLTVGGTTTTVNAQDLVVSDPLIYVGEGNTTNVVDLGIVASFNDGAYQHTGIVRDATDGKWKLFSSVEDEPTTTINFSQANYDTLKLGGVEFSDGVQVKQGVPSITEINQKTAAYTTVLSDRDKLVEVQSSSAVTVTIPANADVAYPVGTSFDILQTGTGQITIAGAAGVTVNATPGLKLRTQWSSATVFKRATNTWVVFGDLTA